MQLDAMTFTYRWKAIQIKVLILSDLFNVITSMHNDIEPIQKIIQLTFLPAK